MHHMTQGVFNFRPRMMCTMVVREKIAAKTMLAGREGR
jgi:hypothetical protein